MYRALIVDDDAELLASIRTRGRRHRQTWSFVTALGGSAAIELLAAEPFDLVLTDLSMPGLAGSAVLAAAREKQPTALRFVLSGRADRWLAKDAATAHQIFTKPADLDDIVARAETALTARGRLTASESAAVTSGAAVPPSPKIFAALHAALSAPDYEAKDVAQIVEQDMSLTSRVLQLASSSALGPQRKVSSVRSAVVALGQSAIEQLVLLEEVLTPPSASTNASALRDHSLLVGRLASVLDPRTKDCFIAGVLHDVGHRLCDEPDGPSGRHTLLGSYLAALWGFPSNVVDAIREHHHPAPGNPPTLAAVLWAADRLAEHGPSALDDGSADARYGTVVASAWREAAANHLKHLPTHIQIPPGAVAISER